MKTKIRFKEMARGTTGEGKYSKMLEKLWGEIGISKEPYNFEELIGHKPYHQKEEEHGK